MNQYNAPHLFLKILTNTARRYTLSSDGKYYYVNFFAKLDENIKKINVMTYIGLLHILEILGSRNAYLPKIHRFLPKFEVFYSREKLKFV